MGKRMPDGSSRRDHLRAVARAGIDTGELDPPHVPAGGDEIITAYLQLRRSAGSNGMGPNGISLHDVLAWQALYGVTLDPAEIDWIFDIDAAVLAALSEDA